jgi:hypothetical protein
VRERDLVQVERSPELIAGADDRGWIRSGERFPERFRQLEPGKNVVAVRKIAYGTREIVLSVSRNKDHVRVRG